MDFLANLNRLFVHDDWANREVLAALSRAENPPPEALRWLAHILAAERLWLVRLREEATPVVVWPDFTLDRCAAEIEELAGLFRYYLSELDGERLAVSVSYVNSQGERWASRVEDVLLHLVMHSTYHRGQIAAAMREAGATPAYTDFIHAVRQGFVE
jgi:uncharacterized damage-inducible protein DinB